MRLTAFSQMSRRTGGHSNAITSQAVRLGRSRSAYRKEITTRLGNPDWAGFAQLLEGVSYETLRKAVVGERSPARKLMDGQRRARRRPQGIRGVPDRRCPTRLRPRRGGPGRGTCECREMAISGVGAIACASFQKVPKAVKASGRCFASRDPCEPAAYASCSLWTAIQSASSWNHDACPRSAKDFQGSTPAAPSVCSRLISWACTLRAAVITAAGVTPP